MINTDNFEFDATYHIFSHGNGKELIFREDSNYLFFLKKFGKYIAPVADIYAYCLLPNHFHLLLKFRNSDNQEFDDEHKFLMKQLSNFLNSYAKAFNKVYDRRGALFLNPIKRKRIDNEKYLLKVLHYIHNNPLNHGIVSKLEDWKHSSYKSYLNADKESKLDRFSMLNYFDSIVDFIAFHHSNVEYDFLSLE